MTLQASSDLDLLVATLPDLGEYKWTDAVATIQKYVFLSNVLTKERTSFESGTYLQRTVQVKPGGSASMVGLMATDVVNITNTLTTLRADWRHCNTNWAIDQREIAMNREPRRILELLKSRRATAMRDLAELLETQGWGFPSASDGLSLFGIQYWCVPSTTQGFNGGNPFGYSAGAGGISSSTYDKWANYTDAYSEPTQLDLIRRWRRAAYFTDFESPVNVTIPSYNKGNRYGYYTTYFIQQRTEDAAAHQNDDLGMDIASTDGKAVFRRVPIVWVPKFDQGGLMGTTAFSNTTYTNSGMAPYNPIYGINWGVFEVPFLSGWYMREQGPYVVPGQHTVMAVQVDSTLQTLCMDRRRLFVLTM